ncbi:DUF4269 domain-containing protein [Nesterenkonia xinjiangensis]|uniref:DUF4269 domain-containing protein n=1 Tax=Nesterenkonia xinjiangensis TaxID=225327 RepID=A0A7Z0GL89_9MICC|nr:DUF4269 domain-containing protein [Nesterenkonia xinjiangensis]NYJ77514.1 hypothetical protein [Nesterenkonia xinjiangensis]
MRLHAATVLLDTLGLDDLDGVHEWALAGTLPIGVDVEGSDLDVLIHAEDIDAVHQAMRGRFAHRAGFATWRHSREDAWCAAFEEEGFLVELFIQAMPVAQQRAHRHMLAERRLLRAHGTPLRDQVRALKSQGIKTEPAFARALGIPGDPYTALLDDDVVTAWCRR